MSVAGTVTRKGQITFPAEMRRTLGIEEGDRVVFRLSDGVVTISPAGSLASKLSIGTSGVHGHPLTTGETVEAAAAGFAAAEETLMEELGFEPRVR